MKISSCLALMLCGVPFSISMIEAAPVKKVVKLKWPTFRQNAAKKAVPEIKAIQYLLRARGFYKLPIDGVFGAQTAASVRAFQRKNGLKADGVVAAQTFPKLIKTLKRGDKGDAVRALQTLLRTFDGHSLEAPYADMRVDGVFGSQTEQAVRYVQEEAGVGSDVFAVDGIVGTQTWCLRFAGKNYFQ